MKQSLTFLFIFLFSFLNAQTITYPNDTDGLKPLGYSDDSNHFIEIKNKTAVYDILKKKVIGDLDGRYRSHDILMDKYLKISPSFSSKDENNYSLFNLKNGKHIGGKMFQLMEKENEIYSISVKGRIPNVLGIDEEWQVTDEYPKKDINVKEWKITFDKLAYKDYIINKENKTIVLNGNTATYFYSCGPYLVFSHETNTLIDTNGVVVKIDPEVIKDIPKCHDYLSRIDYYEDIVQELYSGEEYKASKLHKVKDKIYFKSLSGDWKCKDKNGEYHILDYSEIYVRNNTLLFGKRDNKYYYLSSEDHTPILELGKKFPRVYPNDLMWVRSGNRLYDLKNNSFLTPADSDDSFSTKMGFGYSKNGIWRIQSFMEKQEVEIEGGTVKDITEEYISAINGEYIILYNWKGDEIDRGRSKGFKIIGQKYFHSESSTGQYRIKEFGWDELDFPNYKNARLGKDNIMLVHYITVKVYDKEQKFLYEVDNYESHSKVGIYSYGVDQMEFRDFDGEKKKAELDILEEIRLKLTSETFEDRVLELKSKINLLDSFLLNHPFENEAIGARLEIGTTFLGTNDDPEFERFLDRISKELPQYTDIEILKNIVKGNNDSTYRKNAITEIEHILEKPNLMHNDHFYVGHDEHFYGIILYHLGYLYHLENKTVESKKFKGEAFNRFENFGFSKEIAEKIYTLY